MYILHFTANAFDKYCGEKKSCEDERWFTKLFILQEVTWHKYKFNSGIYRSVKRQEFFFVSCNIKTMPIASHFFILSLSAIFLLFKQSFKSIYIRSYEL